MVELRITFGQRFRRDTHKTFPDAHPDGWVTIIAPTAERARAIAFAELGEEWSFDYDMSTDYAKETDWSGFFPLGELGRITVAE